MKSVAAMEVPKLIQSNNNFVRAHWTRYQKYKKEWFEVIGWLLRRRPSPPDRKMRIVITSRRKILLDDDNLRGGAKPIPDALKKLNIIRDDSPEWFQAEYRQEISAQESTTIEIYEVHNPSPKSSPGGRGRDYTEERVESGKTKRPMEQDRRPRRH